MLEAGLAQRPGQVAATVAKARCLIELERPLDAWDALEPLLARDPGHLVAAKLAVEIFLRVGDLDRARASLARYVPLGTADPDLVRLKTRVGELEAAAATAAVAGTAAATGTAVATGTTAASGTPIAAATAAATAAAGDASSDSAAAENDDEVVTVTLGNLYLLQGHRAEAERIFRRVLRADPDHPAARQALARVLSSGPRAGTRTGD